MAAQAGTLVPFRFVDALIGGVVALAVSQLAMVRDPLAPLVDQARQTFADLADLLGGIHQALDRCDETAAQAALDQARQVDDCVDRLRMATRATGEALQLRVSRRQQIDQVQQVTETARQLDYAARNIRVLARAGVTLTRLHTATPPELCAALDALTWAIRAAGEALATDLTGREEAQRHAERADAAALEAVRIAAGLLDSDTLKTELLGSDSPLPLIMIVGQIRATAIDLLRGVGGDDLAVLGRVDEALGLPAAGRQQPMPSS